MAGYICADSFVKDLLDVLQVSRQPEEDACHAAGGPEVEESWKMQWLSDELVGKVKGFTPTVLSKVVCELSKVIFQLRAWYSPRVGVVLLAVLNHVAAQTHPLPGQANDPGLAVLRLLEGVLLICTVQHAPAKVAECLELLVRRRRVLPLTSNRLEAALVRLSKPRIWPGVPTTVPLDEGSCNPWLTELAEELKPAIAGLERISRAKADLERAVEAVFPGVRPQYFGGSVNGFQTTVSDVDCVLILAAEDVAKLLEGHGGSTAQGDTATLPLNDAVKKKAAAKGAQLLGAAMKTDKKLTSLGLKVVEVITDARVPLLKCESAEGVPIDVSFNNTLPLHNSRLLLSYAELDPRAQQMGRLVKWWAKKRLINDAHDGTLSAYSHILLVIHYLQRVGMLPNLQDKDAVAAELRGSVGIEELVDGIHDVWFLDPKSLHARKALEGWVDKAPDHATLHGLLAGYFHYLAYELPVYSHVASIRHPQGLVPKMEYFPAVAEEMRARHAAAEDDLEEDADLAQQEVADAPVDGGLLGDDQEGAEAEVAEPVDDEPSGANLGQELAVQCGRQEEMSSPAAEEDGQAKLHQTAPATPSLAPEEHKVQALISCRQVLCIDDPMELGRTLSTKFQGTERITYEARRACELMKLAGQGRGLEELFSPAPTTSLRTLLGQCSFPSIFGATRVPAERKIRVEVPQAAIGRILGKGGANIREMQNLPGMQTVRLVEDPRSKEAYVQLSGSAAGVENCAARLRAMLPPRPDGGASASEARGKGAAGGRAAPEAPSESPSEWPPLAGPDAAPSSRRDAWASYKTTTSGSGATSGASSADVSQWGASSRGADTWSWSGSHDWQGAGSWSGGSWSGGNAWAKGTTGCSAGSKAAPKGARRPRW